MKHVQRLLFLIAIAVTGFAPAKGEKTKVMVMKISSEIDPRTNRYSELALEEAKSIDADLVILELDTYGGAVNDADDIRTRILEFEKPIYVFINKDAASAGALISIACDSIYMAPGASIGAATVVVPTGQAAPDKYQSYMRSIMRSTAEANGRDPKIAEAMVDQSIELDSISEKGKVLTFSTSEAIKYHFCEAKVNSIEDILTRNGVTDFQLVHFKLSLTDKIIRLFLNPFISGLLILIIIGGIYFELQTPGVGFPILASILAAILYFTPYYLHGLAANWEIVIFFVGVILLMVEIFVIPGFGIAGISGITLMLASLVLVMLNNDLFDFSFVNAGEITKAIAVTFSGLIAAILLMFWGGAKLTTSGALSKITLQNTQDKNAGYTSNFNEHSYRGMKGEAYTVLRPSGKILIEGEIKDAFTRGEYVEKGAQIEVIGGEGSSLIVKKLQG